MDEATRELMDLAKEGLAMIEEWEKEDAANGA